MTYNGIICISNEIRFVLDTARQVNLAAQNASLAARRAGNVRGFQAVSAELKVFSQGLAEAMQEMSQDILAISQSVSANYRQLRVIDFFTTTLRTAGNLDVLANAQKQARDHQEQITTELFEKGQKLEKQLARSMRICSNGRALARSAMIEAASGGEWEKMLKNVAYDIEGTIMEVHERLKIIGARLKSEYEIQ